MGQDRGRRFAPKKGITYKNRAGGEYICTSEGVSFDATMENIKSGWHFIAHGLLMYEDGTIEWDYSTGGTFAHVY